MELNDRDDTLKRVVSNARREFRRLCREGEAEQALDMADVLRGQVLVFEENIPNVWTGLGTFGRRGSGIKELLMPMDVVVDEVTSTIYVTNFMKARLEVFTMGDMVQ